MTKQLVLPGLPNTPCKPQQKFYAIDKLAEVNYRPKAFALVEDLSSNRRDLHHIMTVMTEGTRISKTRCVVVDNLDEVLDRIPVLGYLNRPLAN